MKKVVVMIIAAILMLFIFGYSVMIGIGLLVGGEPIWLKIVLAAIGAVLLYAIYAIIKVTRERIKEIEEEDEDDLSKY